MDRPVWRSITEASVRKKTNFCNQSGACILANDHFQCPRCKMGADITEQTLLMSTQG